MSEEPRAEALSTWIQKELYSNMNPDSLLHTILRKTYGRLTEETASRQGQTWGRKNHPFNRTEIKKLMTRSEHHSTCIHTKVNACVGLGHVTEEERMAREAMKQGDMQKAMILRMAMGQSSKVDDLLDPLCEHSWLETLCDAAYDFYHTGEAYLEIVRDIPGDDGLGPITGIHHLPSECAFLYLEQNGYDRHFEVDSAGEDYTQLRRFAAFGDLGDFRRRWSQNSGGVAPFMGAINPANVVSEVIQIRKPTALSRWYGYADWIPAVATIELTQCLRQWKYDFFNNRGVPEFMLFILGQKLDDEQWKVVTDAMKANVGKGNSHKSMALNLTNPEINVQLEKLAMDNKGEDTFDKTSDTLGVSVVNAHRVPPILAGIQIPGKLGANNEFPNALRAFQQLVISQDQRIFQQTLGNTLGNREYNGGLKLTKDDFELRKITDAYDMEQLDTTSMMRQPLEEAKAEGRDLNAGLKD